MTMTLLSTITVGAAGSNLVTFSNIPQTANHLVILISSRSSNSNLGIRFNNSTNNFSSRVLRGTGTSAQSVARTDNYIQNLNVNNSTQTANTFSNVMYYIPNYAGSLEKSFLVDGVQENNASASNQVLGVGLRSNTSAITSVSFEDGFVEGTTFYLYTISTTGATGATVS